jgi:hypothetical protein
MKHLIGNCVNSFDEDGDCVIDQLPFCTTSDFACALEEAIIITNPDLMEQLDCPFYNEMGKNVEYMLYDGLVILYDVDQDIHHFFI